jgi:two-component sensor histidine kinase
VWLEVRDNGESFDLALLDNVNSLGMELIRSLCEQLDARYEYAYANGCLFTLSFRKTIANS